MSAFRPIFSSLIAAGCLLAVADEPSKLWIDTYSKMAAAMGKSDVSAYMAFLDKSFVYANHGKETKLDEYKKLLGTFLTSFTDVKTTIVPLKVTKKGDTLLITHHYTFTGTSHGKDGTTKVLRFFQDGTDTWVSVKGRYLQTREEVEKEGLMPGPPKGAG